MKLLLLSTSASAFGVFGCEQEKPLKVNRFNGFSNQATLPRIEAALSVGLLKYPLAF